MSYSDCNSRLAVSDEKCGTCTHFGADVLTKFGMRKAHGFLKKGVIFKTCAKNEFLANENCVCNDYQSKKGQQ